MHSLYEEKRHAYLCSMIADNRDNPKKLWCTYSAVTGKRSTNQASSHASSLTAEGFAKFFTDKIATVRADRESAGRPDISSTAADQLSSWTLVSHCD